MPTKHTNNAGIANITRMKCVCKLDSNDIQANNLHKKAKVNGALANDTATNYKPATSVKMSQLNGMTYSVIYPMV